MSGQIHQALTRSVAIAAGIASWGAGEWVRAAAAGLGAAAAVALVVVAVRKQWVQKFAQFVGDVKGELKKSAWPSWSQLWDSTVVIIVVTLVLGFYIGVVDVILVKLVKLVVAQ